ncbi:MAG: lamin tail domain-containing protein [Archangium sp.]|nr:lamin tail domain-containing protein [Archangium sp.]
MRPLLSFAACVLVACSSSPSVDGGISFDGGLVINELAGTGGDFVELFNAGEAELDLSGMGLTDADADGGIRYATALRFTTGATIAPRGYFTVFLEKDCPVTVTPCVRGEFGLSQPLGYTVTVLDAANETVLRLAYPPTAAGDGFSWARTTDGAETFEVQRRSPGAANAP